MFLSDLRRKWNKIITPLDFTLLALFVLEVDKNTFYQKSDWELTEKKTKKLIRLLERRRQHEPIAYLVGHKEFFGRDFVVNQHTLIPRPESECLIEDVLLCYQKSLVKPKNFFDIGTGSGALIITLAKEITDPKAVFFASDISREALTVAKKNARKNSTSVTFSLGSLLLAYPNDIFAKPCYLTANLPYVSETLYQETLPDVQNYEPASALVSEDEGLAHYKKLLLQMKEIYFVGSVWLEISPEQKKSLQKYATLLFPQATIFVGKDLAQKDRFLRIEIEAE
jgi:release factor glutamine methyltransferase